MIIERTELANNIKNINKWVLVYGRRKTGKTYLVKNFVKYSEYFFVKSDKNIIADNGELINYNTFIEIFKRALEDGKTIAVDEFQRLGSGFFDFLHYTKKSGKVILISSTLFLSKHLISSKSALFGLFAEVPVDLISLDDCFKSLKKFDFSKKERMETAILIREPITIDYFDEKQSARKIIAKIITSSIQTIPALIGEIFVEEERSISAVYEGVLRAIATGRAGSGEITSYLFSKAVIKKDDSSVVQQYLQNLISFGIIKKIEIFNKKKFFYKLCSPLAKIYYYADEKYNISERKLTEQELIAIIDELMPKIVEDNIREYFADKYGLRESIIDTGDFEIDGCLLKFKKPEIAIEVKWGKIGKKDILKAEENLSKIDAPKKIIFVQDKKGISSKLSIMDVNDLIE